MKRVLLREPRLHSRVRVVRNPALIWANLPNYEEVGIGEEVLNMSVIGECQIYLREGEW